MRVRVVEVAIAAIQHGSVADHRVVNVDVVHVEAARVKAWIPRLVEAEREPADSKASAETEADPKAGATQPADERRSIERTRVDWTRAPAPTCADVRPATIVIWSEAPRLVA